MSEQYKGMLEFQVPVDEEAVPNDKKGSKHFKTPL